MKKWIGIVMVIMLAAVIIMPVNCKVKAAGPDVVISSYRVSDDQIYKGKTFIIDNIKLENKWTNDLTNVFINIDEDQSSSFVVKGTGSIIPVGNIAKNGSVIIPPITLTYNGGINPRLPITIEYTGGSGKSETYISVDVIPENIDTSPPQSPETSKYSPKLTILSSMMPTAKAGDTITIPLSIKNVGSYEAKDIVITPQFAEDTPFEIDSNTIYYSVAKIAPNATESISFRFNIQQNAVEKIYPIKINFEYNNYWGDTFPYNATIYIKVINKETPPRVNIKDITSSENIIFSGGFTNISITLNNAGTLYAKDVKVSLLGLKEDGFTIVSGTNSQYTDRLNGGQEKIVNFKVISSEKMARGNYGLSIKLEYKDQWNKEYSEEGQFFIQIYSEDTNNKTVPKIILERYSAEPAIVRAGENFKLNLAFLNTSESKAVQNIKIFLTVNETSTEGGNIFTPVNSSNTFFIDYIEAKGSVSKELTMFTIPDAKAKTYTITANFEYEDNEGNEYKATELIGIPVQQKTRLETSEIGFPPEAYPGQPFPVAFDFYNMGKVTLSNLMIKMEGEFDTQNSSYFVGNFEQGSSDHYEGMVVPRGPGQVTGAVVISYDDPTGQHVELRKDFSFNVVEMPPPPTDGQIPGMEPQPTKQSSFKKLIKSPFLWGGVVIVLGVSGLLIRRRIVKRKGGMTLDE